MKPVFCFSIVRNNQAKGISTAGTLHGQVLRSPSEKRSFVDPPYNGGANNCAYGFQQLLNYARKSVEAEGR